MLEIHSGLLFCAKEEKQDNETVLDLWNTHHCIGETNVIYEHYRFNNGNQKPSKSMNAYTTALHALSPMCKFGSLRDGMIHNQLVCGITGNSVWRKLLQEPKLSLEKCLDICRLSEATSAQLKEIIGQTSSTATPPADDINALGKLEKPNPSQKPKPGFKEKKKKPKPKTS